MEEFINNKPKDEEKSLSDETVDVEEKDVESEDFEEKVDATSSNNNILKISDFSKKGNFANDDNFPEDDNFDEEDYDEEEDEEFKEQVRKRVKRRKIIRNIIIALVAVAVLIFVLLLVLYNYGYEYKKYKAIEKISRKDTNTVVYEAYDGSILKYSRDGMSVIRENGTEEINSSFDMINPKSNVCGDYISIGDIGGRSVVVYDGKGNVYTVKTECDILATAVSANGIVAVLMEEETSNKICLLDPSKTGSEQLKVEIPEKLENGYPVAIDISTDSKCVALATTKISSSELSSEISFYNFTDIGKNSKNNRVGHEKYDNRIIADLEFVNNDSLVAFDDTGFSVWEDMAAPKVVTEEKFSGDAKSIFMNNYYVGYVENTDPNHSRYRYSLYDLKGKKILSNQINFEYTSVYINNKDLVFTSPQHTKVIRTNGTVKYELKTNYKVDYFLPSSKKNIFYLFDERRINVIKLKASIF
ncbi:MAG: DUF5711 family protein [Lachnospiraceae bacterium]|nr:DUF5711 family protein [Lachnospiraceae bacterium]